MLNCGCEKEVEVLSEKVLGQQILLHDHSIKMLELLEEFEDRLNGVEQYIKQVKAKKKFNYQYRV